MWFLVLILSLKVQMPTWYWVLFTTITLIRPFMWIIEKYLKDEIEKEMKELKNTK